MLRILTVLLLFVAAGARAGPWPQPRGAGHLCFTIEGKTTGASDPYATLYTEYGLGHDRTLGLDLGQAENDMDKAVLFLRLPPTQASDGTLYAYELGAGVVDGQPALRPGLSIGRGFAIGDSPAWIALDARAVIFDDAGKGILQSDLTVGAEAGGGNKWMVQLQMAAPSDSSATLKIAPSFAFRQNDGRHLLVGATAGLAGTDTVKITLGLWQKF